MSNVIRSALGALLALAFAPPSRPTTTPIASIRLLNPTSRGDAALVEIPVGQLAAPGTIDWSNIHMAMGGKPVPFAVREGKARWRADLVAPVGQPRAEDILVFSLASRPGTWSTVSVVAGAVPARSAVDRHDGTITIAYPQLRARIDERTGRLVELTARGESFLTSPFGIEFFEVDSGVASYARRMGPSYVRTPATVKRGRALPSPSARLVSSSSNDAMTELNFVLESAPAPAMSLTYRFYVNGIVDISADERPWSGDSPWLRYGASLALKLPGRQALLPDFQTHFPRYGFRDYPSAVQSTGLLHTGALTLAFELGEESINGRFWHRRLAFFPNGDGVDTRSLTRLVDEGLVVQVTPRSWPVSKTIALEYTDSARSIGNIFAKDLTRAGFQVGTAQAPGTTIALRLSSDSDRHGITGDGFLVRRDSTDGRLEIVAGTKFGLYKATREIIEHVKRSTAPTIPLIAENPVVDLRAGGFGGAGHEVDFPLGSDADWERALEGMIGSGMNVMTDLGMWSNWKMPVFFKYMPELQSTSPTAHDEVTGANFGSFAEHRAHGLKLLNYLHDRGVKVWLWLPVGTIPTTFHDRYPDATVPGNSKIPRFMSPKYRELLNAYFKELLEVYPVDGFVLIRDDNGGIDQTEEWKQYLSTSRTQHPVWEQYLIIYDLLRGMNFSGDIAVYPYFDFYEPKLEAVLPKDLLIVGHGSGLGALTRDVRTTGPMGDTWLDNLYTSFRLPTSSRMKRLLSDRSSYWIGGAYESTELPWEAVGYFGWQPTASVNSLRYEFGEHTFGKPNAERYLAFSRAYERLWELMDVPLLPYNWLGLTTTDRQSVTAEARQALVTYRRALDVLQRAAGGGTREQWFAYANHYEAFFRYYARRVELYGQMHDLVVASRRATDGTLPSAARQRLLAMQSEITRLARDYQRRSANVPGRMMEDTHKLEITTPFHELDYAGFEPDLDAAEVATIKQFDGEIRVLPTVRKPGEPFELKIELTNRGVVPWMVGAGNDLLLEGDAARLGLPERWTYAGPPMVYGDRRVITLRGRAPADAGPAEVKISFVTAYRDWQPFSLTIELP